MTDIAMDPVNYRLEMDFDTTDFGSLQAGLEALEDQGISVKLTKLHGPAGGLPVVEITGTQRQVVKTLQEVWKIPTEDLLDQDQFPGLLVQHTP